MERRLNDPNDLVPREIITLIFNVVVWVSVIGLGGLFILFHFVLK